MTTKPNAKNDPEERFISEADSLEEENRYGEALAKYEEGLTVLPSSAWLWARKGRCLVRLQKNQQAVDAFDKAIALQPNAPTTLFSRAQAHEKNGNLKLALDDYVASAAFDPRADAFLNIGLINQYWGRLERAADAYREALRLRPGDRRLYELLGEVTK